MVSQFRIFKEMDIFQRLCLIRLHHLLSHISLYQVRSQLLMIISLRYLCGDPPPTARWPEIGFVALRGLTYLFKCKCSGWGRGGVTEREVKTDHLAYSSQATSSHEDNMCGS